MRLPATSLFSTEVFVTKCNVDWGSEAVLARNLIPEGVFLDVGANVGYYSLYMLPRVSAVHAFEPDPRALTALEQNLSAYPNAIVHGMALGNRNGRMDFLPGETSETSRVGSGEDSVGHQVDVTTVDTFVSENGLFVSGIKIDVEGADIEVLESAIHTLREQQQPIVLTESTATSPLFQIVVPLGYKVFDFIKYAVSGKFVLAELDPNTPYRTKMLFLVPRRLHTTFSKIIETNR